MSKLYLWIGIVFLLVGSSGAAVAYAFEDGSATDFVTFLIARGLIPADRSQQALTIAGKFDEVTVAEKQSASSTKPIGVQVSQLIQFSHLTFKEGADIQGPLLIVTNPDDVVRELTARRRCQVSYKIFDINNTLLFDSATVGEWCTGKETVTYLLPPHGARMFEVTHKDSLYHLKPGKYRFELDYPEYGKGDLTVTVESK